MEAFAGFADERGEPPLDVEMHILRLDRPLERAGADFVTDLRKPAFDVREVARRQYAAGSQHARVSK